MTPVRSRSAHTSRVDVQLNSTMRLISGTLRSAPLPWLPVLSNIEPPAFSFLSFFLILFGAPAMSLT